MYCYIMPCKYLTVKLVKVPSVFKYNLVSIIGSKVTYNNLIALSITLLYGIYA